jgi:predicted nucleotidyltransferase
MDPVQSTSEVIARLHRVRDDVSALGVSRLSLFGSMRRGEALPSSDLDFLVDFAPGAKRLAHLLALGDLLEATLGRPVDLVTRQALSPYIGPHITAEALDVLDAA